MNRVPWPVVLVTGIVGGAVGTIGLAFLLAATKLDEIINPHPR